MCRKMTLRIELAHGGGEGNLCWVKGWGFVLQGIWIKFQSCQVLVV